jgi:hypothetical protein
MVNEVDDIAEAGQQLIEVQLPFTRPKSLAAGEPRCCLDQMTATTERSRPPRGTPAMHPIVVQALANQHITEMRAAAMSSHPPPSQP